MLTPIEEAKFKDLKDKCRELRVPAPPEIMIGLRVQDKAGMLIFDDIQRGHSWLRNFWNFAYMMMVGSSLGSTYEAGSLAGADLAGTPYWPIDINASWSAINVGTSDAAWSVEQYALGGKIASGNGAGQLLASALVDSGSAYASKTWTRTVYSIFNNNSGNSITIKETGLCAVSGYLPLLERSVLSPTVAVPNGAQLTVTYEISMDFSAID